MSITTPKFIHFRQAVVVLLVFTFMLVGGRIGSGTKTTEANHDLGQFGLIRVAAASSVGFPSTGVLDSFDRADGPMGANWGGNTSGYSIAANQLDVGVSEDIYWNVSSAGPDQEAYVTLSVIDPNAGEIGLVLRGQNVNAAAPGLVDVVYRPATGQVEVWTYTDTKGWVKAGADIPVSFVNGDQFGARATAAGQVEVYRNGTLLGSRDLIGWDYATSSGYIGLFSLGAQNVVLDNFGGGTVGSSPTPTNTPVTAPTNTPTPTNTPVTVPTNTPTPTYTPVTVPTNTPTATNTVVSPTSTPTPTSTPVDPTPTWTSTAVSPSGFPASGVLDSFDRVDGPIGPNWSGNVGGYGIASNRLDVGVSEDIYWNVSSAGPDQEAYVTLSVIDPNAGEIGLVLRGQSGNAVAPGLVDVVYRPATGQVEVWTYTDTKNWVKAGADIPVSFVNGDQFGARATAGGQIEVYRNGTLLGSRDLTGWDYATSSGYIGLFSLGAQNVVLDNFGGGTVGSSPTPTPTNTPSGPTPTNTPLAPTSTPTSTPVPCDDPTTCNPVSSVPATWQCNIPGCSYPDWIGSVVYWPSETAYEDNGRTGSNSRTVYSQQGEKLYPYMGAWADGCQVTGVSGTTLIIEWQRGADVWRETYLEPGQSHTISLTSPENGAMIEGVDGFFLPGFTVLLANCSPQIIDKAPTPTPTPDLPTATATPMASATSAPTSALPTPTSTPSGPVACDGLIREAEEGVLSGLFVVGNDSAASGGAYVWTPDGGGNDLGGPGDTRMDLCFTVAQAGTYQMFGSVYTDQPGGYSDSFFVKVDGTPVDGYVWDVPDNTLYQHSLVTNRISEVPLVGEAVELTLSAGQHIVTVYNREDGARLDKFELAAVGAPTPTTMPTSTPIPPTPTPTPAPTLTPILTPTSTPSVPMVCTGLEREAEEGALSGQFVIGNDAAASGGAYVWIPDGGGNALGGPGETRVDLCFTVTEAGPYQMLGSVYTDQPGGYSDSFFVAVDGGPIGGYLWDVTNNTQYQPSLVTNRTNDDPLVGEPVEVTLSAGQHIVTVYNREDGTRLDKLELLPSVAASAVRNARSAASSPSVSERMPGENEGGVSQISAPNKLYLPIMMK